jgi:hypothetical protein
LDVALVSICTSCGGGAELDEAALLRGMEDVEEIERKSHRDGDQQEDGQ